MEPFEMDFGDALAALAAGRRVARAGWNGKGMWLIDIPSASWRLDADISDAIFNAAGQRVELQPFTAMKTADGGLIPWLASQADIHATDWQEV